MGSRIQIFGAQIDVKSRLVETLSLCEFHSLCHSIQIHPHEMVGKEKVADWQNKGEGMRTPRMNSMMKQ